MDYNIHRDMNDIQLVDKKNWGRRSHDNFHSLWSVWGHLSTSVIEMKESGKKLASTLKKYDQ